MADINGDITISKFKLGLVSRLISSLTFCYDVNDIIEHFDMNPDAQIGEFKNFKFFC